MKSFYVMDVCQTFLEYIRMSGSSSDCHKVGQDRYTALTTDEFVMCPMHKNFGVRHIK